MLNETGEFHNDNSCVFSPMGSRGGEAIKQNGTLGMPRGGAEGPVPKHVMCMPGDTMMNPFTCNIIVYHKYKVF